MDEYFNKERKAQQGIFKVTDPKMIKKINEMARNEKRIVMLKAKAEYMKNRCSYEAIFERDDKRLPQDTLYTGINLMEFCYMNADTHLGDPLEPKHKEIAIKTVAIVREVAMLMERTHNLTHDEIWPEIHEEFNLDTENTNWQIDVMKLTVTHSKGSNTSSLASAMRKLFEDD